MLWNIHENVYVASLACLWVSCYYRKTVHLSDLLLKKMNHILTDQSKPFNSAVT